VAVEVSSEILETNQKHVPVCRSLLIWIWERVQLRPWERNLESILPREFSRWHRCPAGFP
jgi:hypothetical protein